MKKRRVNIRLAFFTLCLALSSFSFAQEMNKGIDLSFISGLNIGATTPVPIPKDLKLTSYNPRFNPKFGADLVYYFNEHWGIGTGISLDWKGMRIHTKVTDVHLSIDAPDHGTLTGDVTGRSTTTVKSLYLTQPVYATYRFNPKWQVKTGVYIAETLYRKFKGDVRNLKIVVDSPSTREMEIEYATLDYSSDVHKVDVGLLLGTEYRLNDCIGFFTDFTWAFTPYFSKTVPMNFTMRNIYLSMGMTYRIK